MEGMDALHQMAVDLEAAQFERFQKAGGTEAFWDYDERIIRNTIDTFRELSETYKKE